MKTKILPLVAGAILGSVSFFIGGIAKERELTSILPYISVTEESFRIAIYYDVLKKYDNGQEREAINTLRGWLETDIALVNTYKEQLSGTARERVEGMLDHAKPYIREPNTSLNQDAR